MAAKIIITGRLTHDPEMRYAQNGNAVTNFSMASDAGYGEKKHTQFIRVSIWGPQAEACNQYLKKGRPVEVTGELKADPQTGGPHIYQKKDGSFGASFEVEAYKVEFLNFGNRQNGENGNAAGSAAAPANNGHNAPQEEEIPF